MLLGHEADVARLRFGVVSCANWSSGYFGAYGYLASRDDLDAVIHLGDYRYEGTPGPGDLRPSVSDHELVTLSDYRQWLLDGLTRGTASWNLIGNSVMVAPHSYRPPVGDPRVRPSSP